MAFSVHDDREHYQTLKYIFLSGTSYRTYLCGRAATRYLIALVGIAINLCWLIPAMHLPFHPSWGFLAAGALLGFLVAAGLGMCVASVFLLTIKLDVDVVDALFGGIFVVSGALFPPTAFPPVFARIAEFIPLSSFIELMRRAISGKILTDFSRSYPQPVCWATWPYQQRCFLLWARCWFRLAVDRLSGRAISTSRLRSRTG
jgi:ABC-2 type transport system permease protein